MVLKRLLLTALGALGLGALAAGTALAQTESNIPAPDFFNNQLDCSAASATFDLATPSMRGMSQGQTTPSALDLLLRSGATAMGNVQQIGSATHNLGQLVPGGMANCGGTDATAEFADGNTAGTPKHAAYDVAAGYGAAMMRYTALVTAEGVENTARRALQTLQRDPDASTAALNAAQETLDEAVTARQRAENALNAVSMGPIYQAGITEWRAKDAVTSAITRWDNAVGTTGSGMGSVGTLETLNAAAYNDKFVALDGALTSATGTNRLTALFNDDGELVRTALTTFNDSTANFSGTDGTLNIPDSNNDDVPDTLSSSTFEAVKANRDVANNALKMLREASANNVDLNLATALSEAVRRATLLASHYEAQFQAAIRDNTDLVTDVADPQTPADRATVGEQSVRTYYAAYQEAMTELMNAEENLRSRVAAREAASNNVQALFQSPGAFYQQDVYQKMITKRSADKAVADAQEDGGTATGDQLAAQKAAADAVAAAQETLDTYNSMVADTDNPAVALLDALLKPSRTTTEGAVSTTSDGGNDGQALVDAVSGTYNVAKDARDTANRVADEVSGLTGEGGQVAMNEANIATNTANIATNTENIAMNTGMIMTNAENIATNAENIMTNTGMIMTNADNIATNTGMIMTNTGAIADNAAAIGMNTGAIADLGNRVGSNESAIMRNSGMISDLNESLEVVRAGVAASMALAGMPAINGRGISIGVGSYDGESAFAVGFQIQGEMASFKVGVTSAGGETGASAGVGFQF